MSPDTDVAEAGERLSNEDALLPVVAAAKWALARTLDEHGHLPALSGFARDLSERLHARWNNEGTDTDLPLYAAFRGMQST